MPNVARFLVRCHYFKESGKWYATGEMEMRVSTLAAVGSPHLPYIDDACDQVRRRALGHSTEPLPGLSGGWAGPIVVTVHCESDNSYPTLLLPPHTRS